MYCKGFDFEGAVHGSFKDFVVSFDGFMLVLGVLPDPFLFINFKWDKYTTSVTSVFLLKQKNISPETSRDTDRPPATVRPPQ